MSREIVASQALELLTSMARRYEPTIDVEVVDSIRERCKSIGLTESNPFLCGKTIQCLESGRHLVFIADRITSDMQDSVISAMQFHGLLNPEDIESLKDPWTFLRHLLLHEVAHATDHTRSEHECDQWAFLQLHVG